MTEDITRRINIVQRILFMVLALTVLSPGLFAGIGIAQADGGNVSFGIRPTMGQPDRPETFSYFVRELEGGAVVHDEALVLNSGDVPVTLKVFAADAVTAINGGTSFAQQGQQTNGVSRWLSLDVTEITLEPGEERIVPFTIRVPSDVSPGQYVAGLVVALEPSGGYLASGGEGERQFAARVIRQAGVAVVIEVPGPWLARLEITDAGLVQQDDQGATFVVSVRNTGNVFVKAEGSLLVTDLEGIELASIPLKMDTVLPGDTTIFHVTYPVHLSDGRYLLDATLTYAEGETTFLEGAAVKVKNGQPEVKAKARAPSEPTGITAIVGSPAESNTLFLVLIVVVGSTLVMAVIALAIRARQRSLQRRSQQEPAVAHHEPSMAQYSTEPSLATAEVVEVVAADTTANLTRKVLLADDEEGVLALLSGILGRDERNQVLLARDGQEALEIAKREKPDLIFLDIVMPRMDGYEVALALKSDSATAHIKVVMVSALAQEEDRRRALEVDADGYITKPFDLEEILAEADKIVAGR